MATIGSKLETSVEDRKTLLKAKVDINILKTLKIGSLKAIRKCGVIKYAKFKAKVKELVDL
jgi:hypothetical protein